VLVGVPLEFFEDFAVRVRRSNGRLDLGCAELAFVFEQVHLLRTAAGVNNTDFLPFVKEDISMVKHAANEESPLWTAEERVELAFQKVTEGKEFTEEQKGWLLRINSHLRENLTIEQEDFEAMPIFTRLGGWGRANKVFQGHLPDLLQQFNGAIAA
jgi:hypothetical protein